MRPWLLVACISASPAILACNDDPSSQGGTARGSEIVATGNNAGTADDGTSPNQLCFDTINQYRQSAGLPPYTRWTSIESCADGEAKSDGSTGQAHGAFPSCGEMAQNECPGTPGTPSRALPLCLRAMIAEGAGGGHHDTMLSTKYTKVACGVAVTADGATWSVQNFR
jgi:hypothetical protein